MTFTAVSAGQLVKASVTNANNRHAGRFATDMIPMDNSGVGITDTYDLGTPTYQWKDVNISGKFYQNGVEFKGGGGGGGGLLNAENKSHLEKQGINYPLSDPGICNESYTDSTNLVITPRVSYTAAETTLVADINKTDIDLMNATTGWTAGTNTPNVAQDTTNKIEGTGSVNIYKSSLNGTIDMYKTFTAFSLVDRQFSFSFYANTVTNVTRVFVKLESTVGNDKTWYIPVANFSATTWAHITVNPNTDVADASTGTFNPASITKIYLGMTTSSAQDVNCSFDFLVSVDDFTIVDSGRKYMSFIWDATNQEPVYINSVAGTGIHQRNIYTITALANSYAVGATYAKQRNVTISGNQGVIPSGLSGAVAKTTWDLQEYWLPKSVSNQDVAISWRWWDEEFKVSDVSSSTVTKITSATDKSAYFKNGDKIILYQKQKSGLRYQSRYNSTVTVNFKVLTLSADATHSSGEITLTHAAGTNSGSDNSYWYVVRYSAKAFAKLEAMNANGALAEITPIVFKITNENKLIFSDSFDRANGAPDNNWSTVTENIWAWGIYSNRARYYSAGGATGGARMYRNLEDYGVRLFPIDAKFDFISDNISNTTILKLMFFSNGGTASGADGSGVSIIFNGASTTINAVVSNSVISSKTISPTVSTVYSVRVRITKTNMKIKYWLTSGAEPSAWDINTNITVSVNGNYLNVYGYAYNYTYVSIDNLEVSTLGAGYTAYGVLADGTGDKFVKALQYSRQDTTNQNPIGYQVDGYVPGLTE